MYAGERRSFAGIFSRGTSGHRKTFRTLNYYSNYKAKQKIHFNCINILRDASEKQVPMNEIFSKAWRSAAKISECFLFYRIFKKLPLLKSSKRNKTT